MKLELGDRVVGGGAPCLLVAEVAQAHDGSLGAAHAYIDAAAGAGADAVKFQTHIAAAESTPGEPFRVKFSLQDASRYDYWKRMEFTEAQWAGLHQHAREKGLVFLSSPFSMQAVELLERIGVPAWKVGAGEVSNVPMLERLAATGKPVILSSGMSPWAELDRAVEVVKRNCAVLQCTTSYPCPPEKTGLNVLGELKSRYGVPVGLSDHSGTIFAGLAAAALGCDVLEVHMVFSRECFGPDTTSSVTTPELRQLADGLRFIERAKASPVDKDAAAAGMAELRRTFGKSLVAARALKPGARLAEGDVALKKPGTGIPAARLNEMLGKRLKRSIEMDALFSDEDFEMSGRRRVCVVLVDRANYGRLKPVMKAIQARPELQLQVLCAGTMVLERFDQPVKVVQADGFTVDGQIYTELEGSTPTTMAKSVGFGVVEFASELKRLAPDVVVIIGDRYEALSAALAAAYMNLCIVHLQGGEVSGSIDESARHCITKLSQFHWPATARAKDYLVRMGERPATVLGQGCPSSDIARELRREMDPALINGRGSGHVIDVERPFLLVVFHPVTTEYGGERSQMRELLGAIDDADVQTVILWPNIDAGADHISKAIREYRTGKLNKLRALTNLTPEAYLKVLARCACAIGNSSSFVRDAGYFGTPVALVGARQDGRERDVHVTRVEPTKDQILQTVRAQLAHGRYAPSQLYGDGFVAGRIAESLTVLQPYVQKRLAWAGE